MPITPSFAINHMAAPSLSYAKFIDLAARICIKMVTKGASPLSRLQRVSTSYAALIPISCRA